MYMCLSQPVRTEHVEKTHFADPGQVRVRLEFSAHEQLAFSTQRVQHARGPQLLSLSHH